MWVEILFAQTERSRDSIRRLLFASSFRYGRVVPFQLSDIGEGIRDVTVKEWYVRSLIYWKDISFLANSQRCTLINVYPILNTRYRSKLNFNSDEAASLKKKNKCVNVLQLLIPKSFQEFRLYKGSIIHFKWKLG